MDQQMKYAIIIDSVRSHNALAYICHESGIAPIHIFSSQENFENQFSSVNVQFFFKTFIFQNINQILNELQPFKDNIIFCFGCTDESQLLKEQLDEYLDLPNKNPKEFSLIRNNKFNLYQFLGQPSDNKNFTEFVNKHGKSIIKPSPMKLGGGCINVKFIENNKIEDKENFFISKYFEGDEFAVDFVSCNGKHKLCAVWKYVRNTEQKIWKNKVELLNYYLNKDLVDSLYNKCIEWLNKINHKFGPCHIEIRKNKDNYFCIEMNFRLNGHMSFLALSKCFEINQVGLTLNSFTTKNKFDSDLKSYNTNGYISRIYFCNKKFRKYQDIPWKKIEISPSVIQVFKHIRPWEDAVISEETYQGTTAIIILYNQNYEALQLDEDKLRQLFD